MSTRYQTFLLADDSEYDVLLMRAAFERGGVALPLQVVSDGEQVIDYLRGERVYRDRKLFPLPTAVLLDLNMPRKNGFEVLSWIREQPAFNRLPVHILSASSRPEDIARAAGMGANSFLVKPSNLDELTHLVKTLVDWLEIDRLSA